MSLETQANDLASHYVCLSMQTAGFTKHGANAFLIVP